MARLSSILLRTTATAAASLLLMAFVVKPAAPAFDVENDHIASAFLFAGRHDWAEALQHAKASGNTALMKLTLWQYYLDGDSGAAFDDITRFIAENPDWPEQKKLRIHAEIALKNSHVPDAAVIHWFGDSTPVTGVGKIELATALQNSGGAPANKIAALVRDGFKNGDFDEAFEKSALENWSTVLRQQDVTARIDRELWEEKISEAEHLLPQVPRTWQRLFKARMALIKDKKGSPLMVAQVEPDMRKDPGLMFDRMRFRARRDDDAGVQEILLGAPAKLPYPEKWWRFREQQIRKAAGTGHYALAQKLISTHADGDTAEQADADWIEGWLKLQFLKKPKEAYALFYKTYDVLKFPTSRARAAYWAARAAEESGGDTEAASGWYASAAAFPTTFYGQLALLKAHPGAALALPGSPRNSEAESRFAASDVAQAIELCADAHELELAQQLVTGVVENGDDTAAAAAVAFGTKQHPSLGVHGAKKAMQHNIVMIDAGYPTPELPSELAIEPALALAIVRQESEFNERAKSPAGAVGMMQLLPSTAKETAKKADLGFARERLYEPDYNITIASHYFARLMNGYNGSYVLSIAAYNAGPGNVHDWLRTYGSPGSNPDDAVDWIEKIPFSETRSYVQHVLANLEVYRGLTAQDQPLKLSEDLVR